MSDVSIVTSTRATLGEGPIWYEDRLYWVDIEECRVYIYDPADESQRCIQLEERVGTVVPRAAGGLAVALQYAGFALLAEDGRVEPIANPEPEKPTRFNDGKCDPAGRFWAGTMGMDAQEGIGTLYVLDTDRTVHRRVENLTISNGICWSADARQMYFIDTPNPYVFAFDYDLTTGEVTNRRTIIELNKGEGAPDGMAIDADGNLWIALFGGGAVVCHDPRTGKRLHKVHVPAVNTTACAFGGPGLEDLYITSATYGLHDDALRDEPRNGALFRTRVGARGVPTFAFQG